jgi:hypothetical protein
MEYVPALCFSYIILRFAQQARKTGWKDTRKEPVYKVKTKSEE